MLQIPNLPLETEPEMSTFEYGGEPLEEYQAQNRGGVGTKSMSTYEDDGVEKIITTNTQHYQSTHSIKSKNV